MPRSIFDFKGVILSIMALAAKGLDETMTMASIKEMAFIRAEEEGTKIWSSRDKVFKDVLLHMGYDLLEFDPTIGPSSRVTLTAKGWEILSWRRLRARQQCRAEVIAFGELRCALLLFVLAVMDFLANYLQLGTSYWMYISQDRLARMDQGRSGSGYVELNLQDILVCWPLPIGASGFPAAAFRGCTALCHLLEDFKLVSTQFIRQALRRPLHIHLPFERLKHATLPAPAREVAPIH
ncbi:hypothetical protein DFP72DRAFT_862758 [Ephemerocybe angulata]|uniref:Uncharacterized protein n=1 Tax=Ephemerocybe angulata TaxID=980116 RepID=A0A8H6H6B2_9AGAR|nr:hypothetical protein DFP72DRAFT_862758 [Tulosesus angulatus]